MFWTLVVLLASFCPVAWGQKSVRLPDADTVLTVKRRTTLVYSSRVHASTGVGYEVDFDSTAFRVKTRTVYDYPERQGKGMVGADAATRTVRLKPKKRGVHEVRVVQVCRGKRAVYRYKVSVK